MFKYLRSFGCLGLAVLLLAGAVFGGSRITGDGGEYLLMTHAMLKHGTPEIRRSDIEHFLPVPAKRPIGASMHGLAAQLDAAMRAPSKAYVSGFFPTAQGRYYAMHFWLYSLLALPFYALTTLLGLAAGTAFGMLNMACAGAAFAYLRRAMPQHVRSGFALFLLMGTSFYLPWSGPEVMSAACALVATVAMLRGETGLSMLAAGLGAAQNPSLALMMPFALALRLALRAWPQLAWPGAAPRRLGPELLMGAAGVICALAPFAYFEYLFGTPSLIAQYSTRPELITGARLFSVFFDLNQGMLIGLPGLFVALPLAAVLVARPQRRRFLLAAAPVGVCVLAMALPALSATNWNSGAAVMLRYAYWLAMPALALLLYALTILTAARRRIVLCVAAGAQLLVFMQFGLLGERSSTVHHTALANAMLAAWPHHYNPDPEIFYERGIGREVPTPLDEAAVYAYRVNGAPVKLMRHWSRFANSAGLCQDGARLLARHVRTVDGGWQYLHAPFTCVTGQTDLELGFLGFNDTNTHARRALAHGWSVLETTGVWTDGTASTLTLSVPAALHARRILVQGHYYGSVDRTEVELGGVSLGQMRLDRANSIAIPAAMRDAPTLTLVLRHAQPQSPRARGESQDARALGFFLEALALRAD
ncbi:MAG: hypothetical protein V4582_12535 [Pseudomonadota bacterium]